MRQALLSRAALVAALGFLPGRLRAQDSTTVHGDSAATRAPAWRYQADFGFQDMSGNRELTVVNGSLEVEHEQHETYILNLRVEARYGSDNQEESVDYQLTEDRFDWRPEQRFSPYLTLDAARDPVRETALRLQEGTGINVNIERREDDRTTLSLGVINDYHQRTAGIVPGVEREARWSVRGASAVELGPITRLEVEARYQPSFKGAADYLVTAEAALRVAITKHIGFLTRFQFLRDSRPATGVQPDDHALTAAFSLAW